MILTLLAQRSSILSYVVFNVFMCLLYTTFASELEIPSNPLEKTDVYDDSAEYTDDSSSENGGKDKLGTNETHHSQDIFNGFLLSETPSNRNIYAPITENKTTGPAESYEVEGQELQLPAEQDINEGVEELPFDTQPASIVSTSANEQEEHEDSVDTVPFPTETPLDAIWKINILESTPEVTDNPDNNYDLEDNQPNVNSEVRTNSTLLSPSSHDRNHEEEPGILDQEEEISAPETTKEHISDKVQGPTGKHCVKHEKVKCPRVTTLLKGERGRQGIKGNPGPRGFGANGIPGAPGISIIGPKGDKGEPCLFEFPAWSAENKKNIEKDKHAKGEIFNSAPAYNKLYEIVPGAIVFRNRLSMEKMTDFSRIGTVIYTKEEDKYYGRVPGGWRPFLMGEIIKDSELEDPDGHFRNWMVNDQQSLNNKEHRPKMDKKKRRLKAHLKMVALNDPWTGDLHGIQQADHKCSHQAKKANVAGNFRAFLSNGTDSLKELVKLPYRKLPILNLKGKQLFRSWNRLFKTSGKMTKGMKIYSFDGREVTSDPHWPQKRVWHGEQLNGNINADKTTRCKTWNSDKFYHFSLASDILQKRNFLLKPEKLDCRFNLIVLCIEVEKGGEV